MTVKLYCELKAKLADVRWRQEKLINNHDQRYDPFGTFNQDPCGGSSSCPTGGICQEVVSVKPVTSSNVGERKMFLLFSVFYDWKFKHFCRQNKQEVKRNHLELWELVIFQSKRVDKWIDNEKTFSAFQKQRAELSVWVWVWRRFFMDHS